MHQGYTYIGYTYWFPDLSLVPRGRGSNSMPGKVCSSVLACRIWQAPSTWTLCNHQNGELVKTPEGASPVHKSKTRGHPKT